MLIRNDPPAREDHPLDEYFKDLLARERTKRVPYYSVDSKYFQENSVVHYRTDATTDGTELRTEAVPMTGTYVDMFDLYGRA